MSYTIASCLRVCLVRVGDHPQRVSGHLTFDHTVDLSFCSSHHLYCCQSAAPYTAELSPVATSLQLLSPAASSTAAPQLPPRLQLPAPTASCLLHCSSPNCHLTCNHRPLLHPPLQLPIYHLACNCCHLLHPFLHCSSPVTTSLATVVSCCILQSTAAPQLPCTSLATGSTSALTYCTAASGPNCHLTCNYRPLLHPPGMAAPQLPPHLQLLSLAAASTAQLVSSSCLLHYSSPIDISLSTAVTRCCLRPLHSLLVLPLPL